MEGSQSELFPAQIFEGLDLFEVAKLPPYSPFSWPLPTG